MSSYEEIIHTNLQRLYSNLPADLADRLTGALADSGEYTSKKVVKLL
jgi:hypothetical protein